MTRTITLRRLTLALQVSKDNGATFNAVNLPGLEATVYLGIDQRIARCVMVFPGHLPSALGWSATNTQPDTEQDDIVMVTMGGGIIITITVADDGSVVESSSIGNDLDRFQGVVRERSFDARTGKSTITAYGYLQRAAEYENYEDPTAIGGLVVKDLTGNQTDTADNIVMAVLDKAEVPYSAGNIGSSSLQYGAYEDLFTWMNGTNPENFDLKEEGESALSYIERYDEIDGDYDYVNDTGERYRTFETLWSSGGVYRAKVSMRPLTIPDASYTINEFGVTDIIDGEITRSIIDTRNYFVVTGFDIGVGAGPVYYVIATSNPVQGSGTTKKRTKRFSSQMVERELHTEPGTGQSCETLANLLALEFNREFVRGWIETWRDDPFGPVQSHLVQGGPGGVLGNIGTGEVLVVQGVEISINSRGLRQRITYTGGGFP